MTNKCENTVLLETQGPCGSLRKCSAGTETDDTSAQVIMSQMSSQSVWWVLGSRPWLFFSFFTSIWHVLHQTFCSHPGWEPARGVSLSLLVNLRLLSWLTPSVSALPPSTAAIGSLFRAPSTRALQTASFALLRALGADTNGCLRQAAPRYGPHDSTSHKPRAMAPPPRLSGVTSCMPSGVASSEASSVPSSRHATLFQPSLFPLRNTARSSTRYRTSRCFARSVHHSRRARGLPVLQHRLSEMTLLNTHLHVLRADCWCSSAALNPLRALRV